MGINKIYFKFRKAVSLFFISKLHSRKIFLKLNEPVVSFTFDDIPRSAVENGESILRKYNFTGTYYISIAYMKEHGFNFNGEDAQLLQQIVDRGGELACHTYSHLHFFKTRKKEILDDLEKNRQYIESHFAGSKLENFSYPFGEQTSVAREIIKKRYRSGRSVYKGVNESMVDLNCLKCVRIYESMGQEKIFSLLEKAIDTNGWIIFYTHDVASYPSNEGCTPAYFDTIVRYCFEKKLKVLPVNKVIDLIQK